MIEMRVVGREIELAGDLRELTLGQTLTGDPRNERHGFLDGSDTGRFIRRR